MSKARKLIERLHEAESREQAWKRQRELPPFKFPYPARQQPPSSGGAVDQVTQDVIDWAPALFDEFTQGEIGVTPPDSVMNAVDAAGGGGTPIDNPELHAELAAWLNANWKRICATPIDGEACPRGWRRVKWTPEMAAQVLANL